MDLHTRMKNFGGPVELPSAATVQADLTRGRKAVRRRRFAQAAAGSAFGIAAVAAAFSLAVSGPLGSVESPPAAAQSLAPDGIQLVSYAGEQPKCFTIGAVPEGFTIKSQNEYELVLAPDQLKAPAPTSSVPVIENPNDYADKIAIFLERMDDTWGDQLTIDGKAAVMRTITTPDGSKIGGQIFIEQKPSVYIAVQVSENVGLNKDQMIELAGGVHVTPECLAAYAG